MTEKSAYKNTTKIIAVIAIYAALLLGAKEALAFIPNVEIVTVLLATLSFTFGMLYALPAALVFVTLEMLLYGFGTWVFAYMVHWPAVAVVFGLLRRVNFKRKGAMLGAAIGCAVVLTLCFGVLTSVLDTFLSYSGSSGFKVVLDDFWYRFGVLYARGIVFFAIHVVSNAALFAATFLALNKALTKCKVSLEL
ncbi:MAG: hypothetical protein NC350_01550 [Corallococcus sp.]|nr:hypothetical protein [Corallococcus sp.]